MATPRTEKRVRFTIESGSSRGSLEMLPAAQVYPAHGPAGTLPLSPQPSNLAAAVAALDARLPLAGKCGAARGLPAAGCGSCGRLCTALQPR